MQEAFFLHPLLLICLHFKIILMPKWHILGWHVLISYISFREAIQGVLPGSVGWFSMSESLLITASGLGPEPTIKPNPAGIQGGEGPCLLGGIQAPVLVLPCTGCVTLTEMPNCSETQFPSAVKRRWSEVRKGDEMGSGGTVLVTPSSQCVIPTS